MPFERSRQRAGDGHDDVAYADSVAKEAGVQISATNDRFTKLNACHPFSKRMNAITIQL
jgi:hypothetical protein